MEFSIAQLLENFSDNKLVAPKAIEKKLGLDDGEVPKLQVVLDALEKVGLLEKDKGRYRRLQEEGLIEGRLRCSSKGFCFAIQDVEGAEDIYIRESRLSTAWNGDRVLVKVTKDGIRRRSPEGEVRLIVERANPTLLAKVKRTEAGYRAVPLDDRLLFEIELTPDAETPDLSVAVDKLIHLEMVRYPLGSHLPIGRIAQVLGETAESTSDIDLVCCKHNLPRQFSDKVMASVAALPKALRKTDLKKRLDLRSLLTVEIGYGPAISLESVESGWRLGVHIPDVATYVPEGSDLDRAARTRLRSFFLGDTLLPMLPELPVLTQPERLTMSVLLQLDENGGLTGFEVYPAVVTVNAQFERDVAQTLLQVHQKGEQANASPEMTAIVRLLAEIAKVGALVRQQREGEFAIALPQVALQEPDEGVVGTPVVPREQPFAAAILEITVLTNRALASHIRALGVPALYRTQPAPEFIKVGDWLKLLESMKISLELAEPEKVQPHDLQRFLSQVSQIEDGNRRDILEYLLLGLLKPCEYVLAPGQHFGLALTEPYMHAIAPQHRYADLLVQRLLHLLFEEGRDRRTSRAKESVDLHSSVCHGQISWSVLPPERERQIQGDLEFLISRINQQDQLFVKAKNDLEGLRKAEFMQARTGQNFFGIITGVQSYGFFVEIESLLVEGLVHVSSLKDDWYEFPQSNAKGKGRQQTSLVGRRSGRQYSLGDRVEVQVKSVDYYRQQIDLVAVESLARSEEMSDAERIERPDELESELMPE